MVIVVAAVVAVAGGVLATLFFWRGTDAPLPAATEEASVGSLQPAEESEQSAQRLAAADDDGDGLNNSEEAVWASNPDNPDTDGDGYLDGEEIAAGHNPTIAAPNDLLSGAPATALVSEGVPAAPLEPDQYFSDNLDYTSGGRNFTQDFEQEYAAPDRSPATMSEYAARQPLLTQLPEPAEDEVPDEGRPDTAGTIANYLAIADNENALANQTLLLEAQYDLLERGSPATMQGLAIVVRLYREQLLAAAVPTAALSVHKLLLGHSAALATIIEQIALYGEDPVKSMVATRQLEAIDRKYYPLVRAEFARLRALQETVAGP